MTETLSPLRSSLLLPWARSIRVWMPTGIASDTKFPIDPLSAQLRSTGRWERDLQAKWPTKFPMTLWYGMVWK